MTLCANGHEVPDRQQYCGRCGTRAGSDGASNPSATPPGEQPSSASRLLAWSSAHASDLWLVAGVLLVVAFVAIAALSHRGTSRSDSASTSDATTGTAAPAPTEEQPFDRCFDDLNAVIAD
ncbi:MAG: hypothetical protein KDB35_23065, partial [Acidimicrobiales bacterium]|nr:hypothetical protein [Acidimicrobiales bacterium]